MMPTNKPRFTITLSDEMLQQIEDYRFTHRCRSQTEAVIQLMDMGLESLGISKEPKEEEPAISDGLTEVEAEFLNVFSELTPSNQRLLLGIGAVILQEQERPAD